MQSLELLHPRDLAGASAGHRDTDAFIAGGTDLLQLMKYNVVAPARLIDLDALGLSEIAFGGGVLRLGARATMADVAGHAEVRARFPAIAQALHLSASPQIRNMGTMAGNLLQRTRCNYFRDTGFACNKRNPGSGCPAQHGDNRHLAILGGSDACIATHPSDMPVALVAFDAQVEIVSADRQTRSVALEDFYRLPGDTPQVETVLQPGDVITAILVPEQAAARHATYLKLRDRTSFAFALVSAAVGLHIEGGVIGDARVALGGVAPRPWRLPQVEAALRGHRAERAVFAAAADLAGEGAVGRGENDFKIELARRAVLRALQTVAGDMQ